MNREQKRVVIAEIAAQIKESQAILAVDYRGISVPQVAELRAGLRQADATFRVVKNSLTERAADDSAAGTLKPLLVGPTALAFVRGDVATAAKTIADFGRSTQLLPFKGGLMDGATLEVEQIRSLSRLPSREVLYGQLVGVVASPVSGLVRSLGALLGGLAVALGQVRDQLAERDQRGAAAAAGAEAGARGDGGEPDEQPAAGTQAAPAAEEAGPPADAHGAPEERSASAGTEAQAPDHEQAAQAPVVRAEEQTGPDASPAREHDEADASSEAPDAGAEEKPAKED